MSLMRDSAVGLWDSPVLLSVPDRRSIFEILRNRGFALWSENPELFLGVSLAQGAVVSWWDEWWQGRVFVLQPWRSLRGPVSLNTLCLPQTKECLPKPVPCKRVGRFFRPSATDSIALFHFLLVFATLRFRLSSSYQCHCQRSCVIPVGKLPKFLQALGSCYYGSKSKLCLG